MSNTLTPLQQRIVSFLKQKNGPAIASEIGHALSISTRSASNSLQFLRGYSVVNDGTVIFQDPGGQRSCAHRQPGPIHWALGPTKTVVGPCPDAVLNERKVESA